MDTQDKYKIVEKIIQTEDESLLKEIKDLLGLSQEDFWNELPAQVKQDIELAESQLDDSKGLSHKAVWNEVKERLKK